MSKTLNDIAGKRFGKLVVTSFAYMKRTRSYWNCVCDCGGTRIVARDHLKNGDTTDCGCYRKHIPNVVKHRMTGTRVYRIWSLMKERCYNKNRREFKNYGGRGIKVCDEWLEASVFIDWALKNGYEDSLTLDRVDNDKDYCPDNCRWVDRETQQNNRRVCRYITYNGETKTLSQWAKERGFTYFQLANRIDRHGWTFERAITEPINQKYSNKKR